MPRSAKATTLMAAAAMVLAGCYLPGGGLFNYTGAPATYYSTEHLPKTVTLVDTCTDEAIFSIEIPPGKQLTVDFVEGGGEDRVHTPDLMRYEIFDVGTTFGRLSSSLSVPNAECRRLDVDFREGPERPGEQ